MSKASGPKSPVRKSSLTIVTSPSKLVHAVSIEPPDTPPGARPKLRGVIHLAAVGLYLPLGLALLVHTHSYRDRVSVGVWVLVTWLLYSISSAFHLRLGSPRVNKVLNRLDHANIYLFIAGSYTPFAASLSSAEHSTSVLRAVWSTAFSGLAMRALWKTAPRVVTTASYMMLGWVALLYSNELLQDLSRPIIILVAMGGLVYTLGGIVYARRGPDLYPGVFGFHELFHLCTVVGHLFHFVAVWMLVT